MGMTQKPYTVPIYARKPSDKILIFATLGLIGISLGFTAMHIKSFVAKVRAVLTILTLLSGLTVNDLTEVNCEQVSSMPNGT